MNALARAGAAKPLESASVLAEALFRPMGPDGVLARTGRYERAVEAIGRLVGRYRPPQCEVMRFPPVMSREVVERSGYLKSFPHLLGCVSCLGGGHGEEAVQAPVFGTSDLVLTPAGCYPLYPIVAGRGPLDPAGAVFDVACECFRREPSRSLDRLQSFRMREYVQIGGVGQTEAFRSEWMKRASGLADSLELPHALKTAHDPFFGRGSQFLAASQVDQALKYELLVPMLADAPPTACMSFNLHRQHFGEIWDLRLSDGAFAHTACTAFGVDRLAVALFAVHGLDIEGWPPRVRAQLDL